MAKQRGAQFEADLSGLRRLIDEWPKVAARFLYEEGLALEANSRERTPVDTGALRASHLTRKPEMENGEIVVKVEVGGPAAPYALYVHEMVEMEHKVGEAKFLYNAAVERQEGMGERLSQALGAR